MRYKLAIILLFFQFSVQAQENQWSGCYLGLNAGYADGDNQIAATYYEGNEYNEDAGSTSSDGSVFGGQFGCDYHVSEKVLAGFQLQGDRADVYGEHPYFEGSSPENYVSYDTEAILTLTARMGYLVNSKSLLYGKLGWAQTRNTYQDNDPGYNPPLAYQNKTTRDGWTAGFGYEHQISKRFSLFAEYNYVELGTKKNIHLHNVGGLDIDDYRASIDQDISNFLVGINFHF